VGQKNILTGMVTAEFGDQEQNTLIEEGIDYEQLVQPDKNKNQVDALANIQAQPRVERVLTPEQEVDIFTDADYNDPSFIRPGQVSNSTTVARHDVVTYTVGDGDTISSIAEKFGIGVNTILWENNLSVTSVIRPDDQLRILPMSGLMYTVAKGESIQGLATSFGVTDKSIAEANSLSLNQSLAVGQKLLIPGGKKKEPINFEPKVYSGISVVKNIIDPIKTFIKPRAKNFAPAIGNRMTWPTVGYRISQYFSLSHFAIDIANHVGTPLYAADAGVIESAGWGRGYGNNIVINHGGGKKTRYAHMSKFYVSAGDVVAKGEQIGEMGNTGWSTGPHVHFEVMINGVKYNPLNYVH
jgi:LysM repeat protein